jgi:hypothetical protein
MRRSRIVAAPN